MLFAPRFSVTYFETMKRAIMCDQMESGLSWKNIIFLKILKKYPRCLGFFVKKSILYKSNRLANSKCYL